MVIQYEELPFLPGDYPCLLALRYPYTATARAVQKLDEGLLVLTHRMWRHQGHHHYRRLEDMPFEGQVVSL